MKTCTKCGHTNLAKGTFTGLQPLVFQAEETPLFTLTSETVTLDAVLCLDCAHVELVAREDEVLRLRKKLEERKS